MLFFRISNNIKVQVKIKNQKTKKFRAPHKEIIDLQVLLAES